MEVLKPLAHDVIVETMAWFDESKIHVNSFCGKILFSQILLGEVYLLFLETLQGIFSDLNHIGDKWRSDSLLNNVSSLHFLAYKVYSGACLLEHFFIQL